MYDAAFHPASPWSWLFAFTPAALHSFPSQSPLRMLACCSIMIDVPAATTAEEIPSPRVNQPIARGIASEPRASSGTFPVVGVVLGGGLDGRRRIGGGIGEDGAHRRRRSGGGRRRPLRRGR